MNATTETVVPHKAAPIKATWVCLIVAWVLFLLPIPGAGLFVGWPLNLVAFILAIVVMARGFTSKGLIPLIASLIVSPIIYWIGIVVLAGTAAGVSEAAKSSQASSISAEATPAVPPADAIKITATELFGAYKANEVAADGKYKGKPLEISGTIESIDSGVMDEPTVQLASGDFLNVSAQGLPKDVAAQLSKGQSITLNCTGAGEVIGSPMVDHCSMH